MEVGEAEIRALRWQLGVRPVFKTVDTCAGEFPALTPYHYSSYDFETEVTPSDRRKVMILGGGPNRIGQGIEFDYCCVHASFAARYAAWRAAQTGIAGSSIVGRWVMMGGQSGVADHLRVGRGAKIAAQTGVMKDVPAGESWFGTPARPSQEHFRMMAEQRRGADIRKRAGKKK